MSRNVLPDDCELAELVRKATRVFVFTGAGVSKESGLPTFRDEDGIWKIYDPMTYATPEAFDKNPAAVWNMYRLRIKQIMSCQPNPAHITIAKMDSFYPDFLLTTQNVDDLHERAGTKRMVKLHGNAMQMRCLMCGRVTDTHEMDFSDEFTAKTLPKCPNCEGLCRPNIVWFGEIVPPEPMTMSVMSASQCDLMVIIGTSGEVSGGYGFTEMAHANNATIIEVNPVRGKLNNYANFWISAPAGEALPQLWEAVSKE